MSEPRDVFAFSPTSAVGAADDGDGGGGGGASVATVQDIGVARPSPCPESVGVHGVSVCLHFMAHRRRSRIQLNPPLPNETNSQIEPRANACNPCESICNDWAAGEIVKTTMFTDGTRHGTEDGIIQSLKAKPRAHPRT